MGGFDKPQPSFTYSTSEISEWPGQILLYLSVHSFPSLGLEPRQWVRVTNALRNETLGHTLNHMFYLEELCQS